jgi:hypothetical protein
MVIGRIQRIWKPAVFHGRRSRQFEGWYYKLVDKDAHNTFAIIPGVIYNPYHGPDPYKQSHAFIQIFNGNTGEFNYFRYNLEHFTSASKEFLIGIGDNKFGTDRILLNIDQDRTEIQGEVRFTEITPWPVKLLTPGAMGPLAFLPRLECFHAIVSFDHHIQGGFTINGAKYDFGKGKGFIGKEWGSSHPSSWIWIQSNHFEVDGTSLNVSIARVPYLFWKFPGFAVGFLHNNKLHRFTTYNRSKISELEVENKRVSITISNRSHFLEVTAHQGEGTMLKSPEREGMIGEVFESLLSTVFVKFYELQKGKSTLLFEGTGYPAGMEIKGDMAELMTE